jgi:exopolysaccharide biosynthesis polyprenyl glycosylphosphotransferase
MKKAEQIFTLLLVPIDAIMVFVAFVVAYSARAKAIPLPVVYIWPFGQYVKLALLMLPVWILAFSLAGLYTQKKRGLGEFGQIIAGASLGAMALVLWVFLNRSDFFSRLIVFYIWFLAIVTVGIGRTILYLVQSNLYLFGAKKKNLIFLGKPNDLALHLFNQINQRQSLGLHPIGIVTDSELETGFPLNRLGKESDLEEVLKKKNIDEVILTDTSVDNEALFHYIRTCQENNVVFKAIPAHAQAGARTLAFDEFEGIPIIEFKGTPLESWGAVLKRLVDFIGSVICIIILSPLMLLIALAIRVSSKGPAIYRNIRVGNKGDFATLKYRTMHLNYCTGTQYGGSRAEAFENKLIAHNNIKSGSAVYKIADDPRVTPVGKFLRRTSLDELPQLFNVFIGNMSLVGPRPHQPREVEKYTREQRKLLLIKPGITGLAQISGRSDLNFDEEASLDIFYLENWSIWLDLYIILKTFGAVVKGKGSY